MQRKTFDTLASAAGLLAAAVLLVAGGLLVWAHSFVNHEVTTQLTAQKIFFPEKGDAQLKEKAIGPFISQYAGKQLTTGPQAKAFADHYIAVHLQASGGGKTYSELSSASRAAPDDQELVAAVNTAFKGETLRGLLLNAYAFSTMGQIALYGGIAAFLGAAVFLLLSILGFAHRGRVGETDEVIALGSRKPAVVEP
jgi:hypothetical protein